MTLKRRQPLRGGAPVDRDKLRIRLVGTDKQLEIALPLLREAFDVVYEGPRTPRRRESNQQSLYLVARLEDDEPPPAPGDLCQRLGEHVRWCVHEPRSGWPGGQAPRIGGGRS